MSSESSSFMALKMGSLNTLDTSELLGAFAWSAEQGNPKMKPQEQPQKQKFSFDLLLPSCLPALFSPEAGLRNHKGTPLHKGES